MQPDGQRAFVACTPDDYIVVIDLKSLTVTGKINAGKTSRWPGLGRPQIKSAGSAGAPGSHLSLNLGLGVRHEVF